MFKPLKSVSVLLLLCAMPAAISYAASDNGATSVNVTQQNGTCKGVVKDKAGEAVIGASVVVKGTTNGVITDLDGNFVSRYNYSFCLKKKNYLFSCYLK